MNLNGWLERFYQPNSLHNAQDGVQLRLKNFLRAERVTQCIEVTVNGTIIPLENVQFREQFLWIPATKISIQTPAYIPFDTTVEMRVNGMELPIGSHQILLTIATEQFATLQIPINDNIIASKPLTISTADRMARVPRALADDWSDTVIEKRQKYVETLAGSELPNIKHYSFDPHEMQGNCEFFTGVAQIPIGLAGPVKIHGEHANGEYVVPLATIEGTLVASYSRGMKALSTSGGITCTVSEGAMQRAPVYGFNTARGARDFAKWIQDNMESIRQVAESTTRIGKLLYINPYLTNRFAFLRFGFFTGDAAGQNMVSRATHFACDWILENYKGGEPIKDFFLEGQMATDKKHSQLNVLSPRGKKVTAEATLTRDIIRTQLRTTPEDLLALSQRGNIGTMFSGASTNGLHAANGLAALFIATGQDAANVTESSAAIMHTEMTPSGDLYLSITLPSLIVATYGGGTSLPTQSECLRIMQCQGKGMVNRYAEIAAATVLAGEISLASAVISGAWTSSHESFGRNR